MVYAVPIVASLNIAATFVSSAGFKFLLLILEFDLRVPVDFIFGVLTQFDVLSLHVTLVRIFFQVFLQNSV